jgi:Nif-specific regulatory protein
MQEYIDLIYTIGNIFTSSITLQESLNKVVDKLFIELQLSKVMVHIYIQDEEESFVDIYRGYNKNEIEKSRFKPGEGIIGRVLKTGKLEIIPIIRDSDEFLNKSGSRTSEKDLDSSFICVPVSIDCSNIGTISADLPPGNTESELISKAVILSFSSVLSAQAVKSRIESLKKERLLVEENKKLKLKLKKKPPVLRLIGQSAVMQELVEKVVQVGETDTTVLITGESGTGKELVAEAIQKNSKRTSGPFIKVNIAALPESLIESELFGHEKGAFTGAITKKKRPF